MTVSRDFYYYKADALTLNLLIVKQNEDLNLSSSSQYDSGFSKIVVTPSGMMIRTRSMF